MSGSKYLKNLLDEADVEWKPLGEIVKGRRGKRLVRSQLTDNGDFAVFQNSMKPLGYYHESNAGAGSAFIICGGAAGEIGYSDMPFWAADDVYYFLPSKRVLSKYIYYWLFTQRKKIMAQVRRASIPRLPKVVIERLAIPLPCPKNPDKSLAIQHEIVNILDTFSALEAELEARQKQYQYYRDQLLSFNTTGASTTGISRIDQMLSELCPEGVKFKVLATITEKTTNIQWPDASDKSFRYIDLSSVDRVTHVIRDAAIITTETAPSRAQRIVHEHDVIFATTRPTLKRYCLIPAEYDGQICSTGFCVLRAKQELVIPNFLFHILGAKIFCDYVETNQRGASYPAISDKSVKSFRIPIPPLKVQYEIVSILDKFDALVNDLSIGLPAEINARRKQYEYYRDLLLSFPESGK